MQIANLILNKLGDIEKQAVKDLQESAGWEIIERIANDLLKDYNPETVDETLEPNTFKSEVLARKKAREMFSRIFDEVKEINIISEHKQINYE